MLDPLGILILVALAIGVLVLSLWHRRHPDDPDATILAAVVDAERDRQKDAALEVAETTRHQMPPGMF